MVSLFRVYGSSGLPRQRGPDSRTERRSAKKTVSHTENVANLGPPPAHARKSGQISVSPTDNVPNLGEAPARRTARRAGGESWEPSAHRCAFCPQVRRETVSPGKSPDLTTAGDSVAEHEARRELRAAVGRAYSLMRRPDRPAVEDLQEHQCPHVREHPIDRQRGVHTTR